jgi:IS30 family transposase
MSEEQSYTHLGFDKRCEIERLLNHGMPLSWVAKEIGLTLSTVGREVKRNRRDDGYAKITKVVTVCKYRRNCAVRALCKEKHCRRRRCASCQAILCSNLCGHYEAEICQRTARAPWVCNGCASVWGCRLHRFRYDAKCAQRMADGRLKGSRAGINSTEEDFKAILQIVKPLLAKGVGLDAIWCTHASELGISKRTLYRWAEAGYGLINMDLPKKVSYKPRKGTTDALPRLELSGRTYADFMALGEEVRTSAFEMDCIEGLRSDTKAILTLLHRRTHFQFGVLLERKDSAHVVAALDWLQSVCAGRFKKLFCTVLTDRGSEFSDIEGMERGKDKKKRCSVYFCDPLSPGQKGACERAHVEVRKVLPKRKSSFDRLAPYDVATLFSHVNSVPRPSLGGISPMELALAVFPRCFFEELGLSYISLKDICLKPSLLEGDEGKDDQK